MLNRLKDLAGKLGGATTRFSGPCLPEELDELASLFRIDLPADYRAHLLTCRRLFAPDMLTGFFLFSPIGIVDTSAQSGTPRRIRVDTTGFSGELPTIPIGGDALGNLFLMSVSDDLQGSVWKWDHGMQPGPDGTLTHGATLLATSFYGFLGTVAEDWARSVEGDSDPNHS